MSSEFSDMLSIPVIASISAGIAAIALFAQKRSAANSGRSATQAEKTHAAKYKPLLSHDFELGHYSEERGGYSSKLTIRNGGEVPISVTAQYVGQIDCGLGAPQIVNTSSKETTIKPGESGVLHIDILTGGMGGRAKLEIRCHAENGGAGTQPMVLGRIDEVLRSHLT